MRLGSTRLLHSRCIKKGRNDCGGADAYGDSSLHELGSTLFVRPVAIITAVVHSPSSMGFNRGWKAG